MTEKRFQRISADIVNGECPTCEESTMLVGITRDSYRCVNCGADLHQHINGKISYLPTIQVPPGTKPFVREWTTEDGKDKV